MSGTTEDPEIVIRELIASWSAAFTRLDADALASLYAEDALFYGSVPTLFRGRAGVAAYFNALTRWPAPTVTFSDLVIVPVGDDLINIAGRARFLTTAEAAPLEVRITWIVIRQSTNWAIVSHHVSPVTPLIARS